ncbi:fumarate reductase flavoprotein subunit [Natranaerovirga hydrolytica]|uniref:Urocanate reductase n=1 Tax=Natranaerovirga hydrolytica TaxID=680378 RepID=A0A4R1MJJ6_9FIRM|nr:flavocytochrome c [Natranaerovirga hydrolytica]TCK92615.1 fumarate reductase flavoprotein subunit [Natranaerovirga hydrolytica]
MKQKKIIAIILCLVLAFMIIGCQSNQQETTQQEVNNNTGEESFFTPGTYVGTASAHNGDLEVEVTVDENAIISIEIIKHNESEGIADPAIERIPTNVVNSQSLAVDSISGATVTSDAIISAITHALEQAGGDIDALKQKSDSAINEGETIEYTADVVVIGGGGAGLSAAVTAHENGANVIVLEKMPRLGGNTILSGGAFNAVNPERQERQGIEDSTEKHYTQTYEGGDEAGNPELVRTFVEGAPTALQWLESLGMEFNDDVFTVLGGMWPRANKPSTPLGTGFIDTYVNYIEANDGIEVLLDTEAVELIMDGDRVVGVNAKSFDDTVIVNANNGVIVATGGFGANPEMREEYNEVWADLLSLKTTNHPGATGDGIVMGIDVNASLVGMEHIQLLPMGDPISGSLSGNIEQGVENRIFVNKAGNRFVDEGARRDVMTQALIEQEDAFMWVIVDSHSYPTEDTKNNFNESIAELMEQDRAYKGDTLEALAEQIGVNSDNLIKAVEAFNDSVEAGNADAFGRTLFDEKLDSPPYYAGARVPTVHHTMGGLEINTKGQVVDTNGNVIPGLYAAGEVTGGIHGTNRLGGNALAEITVFGRIAGESAANAQ